MLLNGQIKSIVMSNTPIHANDFQALTVFSEGTILLLIGKLNSNYSSSADKIFPEEIFSKPFLAARF